MHTPPPKIICDDTGKIVGLKCPACDFTLQGEGHHFRRAAHIELDAHYRIEHGPPAPMTQSPKYGAR